MGRQGKRGAQMMLSQRHAVEAIIGGFVERALPDARDWGDESYRFFEEGRDAQGRWSYYVEADIPTSGSGCWLDFSFVTDAEGSFSVTWLLGMRGGTGEDVESVYVWEDRSASLRLAPTDASSVGIR